MIFLLRLLKDFWSLQHVSMVVDVFCLDLWLLQIKTYQIIHFHSYDVMSIRISSIRNYSSRRRKLDVIIYNSHTGDKKQSH